MAKIRILDDFTINHIAAGEVVERPASIVKELVENSIDAGSTAITIEIKNGGIDFIRVTDNGEGMDYQDALLAFQRHATSKIHASPDLERVSTLGFRGEALASIAAVTQVEMVTRARNNIAGVQIINHGGKILSEKEIGCPQGTTLIIRNIFYNTPARLKFLKSARAETAHISDLIGRLILAHPEISFKYINQGRIVYHSPGDGKILSSIISVYGREVKDQILNVEETDNEGVISIHGFLGKPSLSRTNRAHQSFFVNGRYVKSRLLSDSVEDAYKPYLTINHFPWVVLHINLPPDLIDVNVHPAKTEIRFKEEQMVDEVIRQWIGEKLGSRPYIPELKVSARISTVEENRQQPNKPAKKAENQIDIFSSANQQSHYPETLSRESTSLNSTPLADSQVGENTKKVYISIQPDESENKQGNDSSKGMSDGIYDHNITNLDDIPLKVIGRVFSTYIIVEGKEGIFFVDQHAAHERILFENYKSMLAREEVASQQLLPPVVLELTHGEQIQMSGSLEVFNLLGFDIEPFGSRSFVVKGIPAILGAINVTELVKDLLDQIKHVSPETRDVLKQEEIIQEACKKAVKAHDPLSDSEILALLKDLKNRKIPLTCPHGRPIMISMTRYELERMFKRVQ